MVDKVQKLFTLGIMYNVENNIPSAKTKQIKLKSVEF